MRNTRGGLALLASILLWSAGGGCSVLATASPDDQRGRVVFENRCLPCHGEKGKGDGYPFLKPPPADLTSFAIRNKTDADLLITIRHGHPDTAMGSWRFALTEQEVRDVLAYVRTLQK